MKVLCSQEVVSPHRCGVVPCQVTAKASAPPGTMVCPLLVAPGVLEDRAWSKPIDFYALSCGSFQKQARNLIETAQRKSQALAHSETLVQTALHLAAGRGLEKQFLTPLLPSERFISFPTPAIPATGDRAIPAPRCKAGSRSAHSWRSTCCSEVDLFRQKAPGLSRTSLP